MVQFQDLVQFQGMAYLKLYSNRACTREIDKDVSGDYILPINKISDNAHMPMTYSFYVKNVGSHKAYDIVLSLVSSTIPSTTVTLVKTSLISLEQAIARIVVNVTSGNSNHNIIVRLSYDNI